MNFLRRITPPIFHRSEWGRPTSKSEAKLRIGFARIFHEACGDSPLLTEREDFERMHRKTGQALFDATGLRGSELEGYMPHAELTGFRQACELATNVEAVPLASSLAVPGGPLSLQCFDWLVEDLAKQILNAGELDGIYLALHGSMEVQGLDRAPEGVILERVQDILGKDFPIAVSYDLHANLCPEIVDPSTILVSYLSNPHWDLCPTGFRAGNRLIRTLRGQVTPTRAWRKLPIVLGGGTTISFLPPLRSIFRHMKKLERDPRVLTTSLFTVHPFTSAEDLGWAVHITTDNDPALAERLADELAELAWETRKVPLPDILNVSDAYDEAAKSQLRKLGPITFVDVDDIVGAGAPGGSTAFLAEAMRNDRGLISLIPIHDPAAVDALYELPIGEKVDLVIRGTEGYGQEPVPVSGIVRAKTTGDFGRVVRFEIGNTQVALSDAPPLPIHPKFWRELEFDVRKADVMIQKNFFHYRIFHAHLSFQHIPVAGGGATSFERVRSRSYPVPTYPVDEPSTWRRPASTNKSGRSARVRA